MDVTDATFAESVLAADGPIVVEFWAPWCKPCSAARKILESLASDSRVELVHVNVDQNPVTAAKHSVLTLPTAILFDAGEARCTVAGVRPRSHYEREWADWLPRT